MEPTAEAVKAPPLSSGGAPVVARTVFAARTSPMAALISGIGLVTVKAPSSSAVASSVTPFFASAPSLMMMVTVSPGDQFVPVRVISSPGR